VGKILNVNLKQNQFDELAVGSRAVMESLLLFGRNAEADSCCLAYTPCLHQETRVATLYMVSLPLHPEPG
jgi:hypothetical protein